MSDSIEPVASVGSRLPGELLRREILALTPYHVPDSRGLIKLDAMENPYLWPDDMVDEWLEVLRGIPLNRYPDPHASDFKHRLREYEGLSEHAGILLGNGSDELIQLLLMAFAGTGRAILAPEPTFVMYGHLARVLGLPFEGVPLNSEDFSLDQDRFCAVIRRTRPAIIFLTYPNNPTGNLFDVEAVDRIVEIAPGLVVIDEAYAPFAEASLYSRYCAAEHVLFMRTLSKVGLAGLRLGYLLGAIAWLEQLEKLRLPYNISAINQATGAFALRRASVFAEQAAQIRADRAGLAASLAAIDFVRVYPSRANFLLFRVIQREASAVFRGLLNSGILIKNLSSAHPLLSQCLRVTVGSAEENARFSAALTGL